MSILNAKKQSDSYFRTLKDGKKIFYPQGIVGRRGYYVSPPELEPKLRQDIRRFLNRHLIWCGVLGGIGGIIGGRLAPWTFILFLGFICCSTWLRANLHFAKYTKEMETTYIANTTVVHWSKSIESTNLSSLIYSMLLFLLFIVGSIWLYTSTNDPIMLVCSAVFTMFLVLGGIAIYIKLKKRTH